MYEIVEYVDDKVLVVKLFVKLTKSVISLCVYVGVYTCECTCVCMCVWGKIYHIYLTDYIPSDYCKIPVC